jgi:hypothetical protein
MRILFFLLLSFSMFSQNDTIYLVNKNKVFGKVLNVSISNVVYQANDSLGKFAKVFLPRNTVRLIAYQSGNFEIVSARKPSFLVDEKSYNTGKTEAVKYYKHGGGSFATGVTSFLTGGILGIIPAIFCSATTPKTKNLGLPKDAPVRNKDYMVGYTLKAKKLKQKKVWKAYGIGLLGAIIFTAFIKK